MHLMANDRAVGGAILGASIIVFAVYTWLLVVEWEITLRVTAFLGVTLLLVILAWIGYTMATTPPPEPITDIPELAPEQKPASETSEKK